MRLQPTKPKRAADNPVPALPETLGFGSDGALGALVKLASYRVWSDTTAFKYASRVGKCHSNRRIGNLLAARGGILEIVSDAAVKIDKPTFALIGH